ncbi:MAG: Lipoprotein signal peptidase, partial [uncultured Solirubrobacteraceae bacterium]
DRGRGVDAREPRARRGPRAGPGDEGARAQRDRPRVRGSGLPVPQARPRPQRGRRLRDRRGREDARHRPDLGRAPGARPVLRSARGDAADLAADGPAHRRGDRQHHRPDPRRRGDRLPQDPRVAGLQPRRHRDRLRRDRPGVRAGDQGEGRGEPRCESRL